MVNLPNVYLCYYSFFRTLVSTRCSGKHLNTLQQNRCGKLTDCQPLEAVCGAFSLKPLIYLTEQFVLDFWCILPQKTITSTCVFSLTRVLFLFSIECLKLRLFPRSNTGYATFIGRYSNSWADCRNPALDETLNLVDTIYHLRLCWEIVYNFWWFLSLHDVHNAVYPWVAYDYTGNHYVSKKYAFGIPIFKCFSDKWV